MSDELQLTEGYTLEPIIVRVREHRVILDSDLAKLYGVTTKRLNEQVKRNLGRFPDVFMFKLTSEEKEEVVANCDHLKNLKYSKTTPFAFTEHGAIMAASVLNSPKAVQMSVLVVKTYIQLRNYVAQGAEDRQEFTDIHCRLDEHDDTLKAIISALQKLIRAPEQKKTPIGFISE